MAIALRYAARSDVGLVRSNNQDSGYAGPSLLVVADGMGGHAGGDVASSLAIGEMAPLDGESHGADAVLGHLSDAIHSAHRELMERVVDEPALSGMGTTVTALLRTGGRLALAHIGDSRAYVLRDGQMTQITRDHTFVQRLVDDGRITLEEAEQHPQRSVLMRVLSDVIEDVEPDLSMREAKIGDRYLLCSDGLSSVVSFETIQDTMAAGRDPGPTCEQLVQLALRSGAPDNVTCIVADIVDAIGTPTDTVPVVVGAASLQQQTRPLSGGSAAERAAELTAPGAANGVHSPERSAPSRPAGRRVLRFGLATLVIVGLLGGGGYGAYRWSQSQFFVGSSSGSVAIFHGLPQDLGPVTLSSVASVAADVPLADLPPWTRNQVEQGIVTDDEIAAEGVVDRLRVQAANCRAALATPPPTATPTPSATATAKATASSTTSPKPTKATATASAAATTPAVTPSTAAPTASATGGAVTSEDCRGLG
ncbi:MAG TPA: PP2C family serine/threonine-protein phosphatase [Kineosporiaceae bacterium]|nr:PP2C family serine/threonine-protein phosphatase [Kineosporiaceae bacterium]